MKKLMARRCNILLTVIMMLVLTACGNKDVDKETGNTDDASSEMDYIQGAVKENIEKHGDAEIGGYVTPEDADFDYEDTEGGIAIIGYRGSDTAINIPKQLRGEPVVRIASGAFSNTQVAGVNLADTITTLEDKAFYYCVTLNEIKFGASMRETGESVFEGCSALKSVQLNDGLVTIGEGTFGFCTSLKSIELPETLTEIGSGAFCLSGLESISIPGMIETIGAQAFSTCGALKEAVIHEGVKMFEDQVFEYCDVLEKVEIPMSVEELGWHAFFGSGNDNESGTVTIYAPAGSAAQAYVNNDDPNHDNLTFEAK